MPLSVDISPLTGAFAQLQQVNARKAEEQRRRRQMRQQGILAIGGAALGATLGSVIPGAGTAAGGAAGAGVAAGAVPAVAAAGVAEGLGAAGLAGSGIAGLGTAGAVGAAEGLGAAGLAGSGIAGTVGAPVGGLPAIGRAVGEIPQGLRNFRGTLQSSQFNPISGLTPLQGAQFGSQFLPAVGRGDPVGATGAIIGAGQNLSGNQARIQQQQALSGVRQAIASGQRGDIAQSLTGLGPQAAVGAAQIALGGGAPKVQPFNAFNAQGQRIGSFGSFERAQEAAGAGGEVRQLGRGAQEVAAARGQDFTLAPGATRFDAQGNVIAAGAPVTPKAPGGFSLSPGQGRFNAQGALIASLPETPPKGRALPFTREFVRGGEVVTQELQSDGKTYADIATGPRFNEPDSDTIVTMQPPTGSDAKNQSVRVGSIGGKKRIDGLLGRGWTKVSQSTSADVTKATTTGAEKELLRLNESEAMLSGIQRKWEAGASRFLSFGGRAQKFGVGLIDKAGLSSALPEDMQDEFKANIDFTRDVSENMNLYIKRITGAQMSEAEAKRLLEAVPNAKKDGPIAFEGKLTSALEQVRAAQRRYRFFLSRGFATEGDKISEERYEALSAQHPLSNFANTPAQGGGGQALSDLAAVDTSGFTAEQLRSHNDELERLLNEQGGQ